MYIRQISGCVKGTLAAALIAVSCSATAGGELPPIGAGVNVGSLGAGATLAFGINKQLEARLGLNQFKTDVDVKVDGLTYDGDISLSTTTAILDFYPWQNSSFRLSVGAFVNNSEIQGSATPSEAVTFGSQQFQPEDIGSASATVSFPDTAPYFGLGWGRRTGRQGNLLFSMDAGVFMQGKPTASISVENPNNIIQDEDIAEATQEFQNELDNFEVYPVLTLGLSYTF